MSGFFISKLIEELERNSNRGVVHKYELHQAFKKFRLTKADIGPVLEELRRSKMCEVSYRGGINIKISRKRIF